MDTILYKMLIIFFILSFSIKLNGQNNYNYTQTIRGTVVEKDLQSTLPYASIYLASDSTKGTMSDDNGKFRLDNVPLGRQEIKIRMLGYKDLTIPLLVTSGKEVIVNVSMEMEVLEMEEISVESEKDKSLTNNNLITNSAVNLRIEETNRFAGSRQDPSRMASNFAGVVGGGDLRNDIIVRGNSPSGVLWRLEGIDIPNPNHFSFTGNTGGAFSILNNNILSNSDFLTGAFPAEYGNKTAAVFDVKLRKGNNEKREHTFQIGLNGIEFGTEGPLSKKSDASYLANVRFLTFEALNKMGVNLGVNGIPQFADGVIKIDAPTEKLGTFSIWAIGGSSKIYIEDPILDDSSEFKETIDDFKSSMYAIGVSNNHFLGKNTSGKLTISRSGSNKNVVSFSNYRTEGKRQDYDLKNIEGQNLINYTITHRFNPRNLVKVGVIGRDIFYSNDEVYYDTEDSIYINSWDQKGHAGFIQAFTHWQHAINEKITFNTGIYYQNLLLNNTQSLEPRFAILYTPDSKQKFSLATGLHSQMHDLFVYQTKFLDTVNNTYYQPNKDLKFTKSFHIVGGYQRMLSKNLRLKTEAYYQHLYNVPVTASSKFGAGTYSILNSGADYSFYIPDSTNNNGTGKNIGLEITIERYFNKDYYLLGNLSLFNSQYKGYDKVERNTAFNMGHVANVLLGREFHLDKENKRMLSADIRINYTGGRRIVDIDTAASMREDHAVYDYSNAYESRLKDYFRTDIKISYTINRPSANHNIFIAADNVLNTQNEWTEEWNNGKKQVETIYHLGIFPYLGYRVQF